ncbi:MAG: dienelactone hydrolase [Rhodoferax sp.]|jgi:predicted dienelactone hydrolase|nr:dienelactone hydrolase [Rhodoferax sp.]
MRLLLQSLSALVWAAYAACASAGVGLTELPADAGHGPITVFYPSDAPATAVQRGPFRVMAADNGAPVPGNRRLIVISHGSGANAMVQADIAQALVRAGYIVALPEHAGDNWHDMSRVGPASWQLRPFEVLHAIDVLGASPRFAPLFDPQRIGMFGMSAGGHTALTLAGGRWSRARLLAHCEAHLAEDFAACTGAAAELKGDVWDSVKKAVALPLIRQSLGGKAETYGHTDPRIRAVVAGVPFAADFDLDSLTHPVVPLGIVQAEKDRWLVPQFHSMPVIAACRSCETIASLASAGHGALLAPLPPDLDNRVGRLLADPPGFDRAQLPALYDRIARFFDRHLLP